MRFETLTVVSLKITVQWGVTPFSLVDGYHNFRGNYSKTSLIRFVRDQTSDEFSNILDYQILSIVI
jgi:hypothetical protein